MRFGKIRSLFNYIKFTWVKILGVILVFIIWILLAKKLGSTRLPYPKDVLTIFINSINSNELLSAQGGGSKGLLPHIIYTLKMYFWGTSLGIVTGISVGLLMAKSNSFREIIKLPIELIRAIPPLAAIPFFLMWFGTGKMAQISILAFFCFFMIIITTNNAIKNINPIYKDYAKTLGASETQILKTILLPGMVPELISGIRVSLAVCWGLEVVAELLGAPFGIGKVFTLMVGLMAIDVIIVGIIWIALFAITTDIIFTSVTSRLIKWQE